VRVARPLSGTEAKRLNREWRRRTDVPVGVLLDGVQQPFNVGSIVRTAAAFRASHLWIAGTAPVTPDHPKSRKTSLGTERLLPWSTWPDVSAAAADAKAAGFVLVGVELATEATPLPVLGGFGDRPVCLVLGHEERGLSRAAIAACDAVGYVPTPGKVGSLNVAVAAGIALYEVRRREWTATTTSEAAGVDLDPDAPDGGAARGGDGVGQGGVVGGAEEPPAV
jgi:tRNA (guanosine-2'-O-)-methyltransferase